MVSKFFKVNLLLSLAVTYLLNAGCAVDKFEIKDTKPSQTADKKNIILITISTLRADHTSCFGYDRDTTPNFDQFAKENILFTNAFATSSWQTPSIGSIFTSLYPSRHGATHINNKLGQGVYTLAEILSDNGYYCVGFCCNPRLNQEHGFAQGFDFYDDYSVSMMLSGIVFENEDSIDINKQRTNDFINDTAIRWLRNNTHRPFFMFLHYYDNHWDYLPGSSVEQTCTSRIVQQRYQGQLLLYIQQKQNH